MVSTIYGHRNIKREQYFERGLDVKEIAKEIRKDFKKAYPDIKISTRISRGGYTPSINCNIKEIPMKYIKNEDEYKESINKWYYMDNDKYDTLIRCYHNILKFRKSSYLLEGDVSIEDYCDMSEAYVKDEVMTKLKEIYEYYNYDNSDVMTDYFEVGYYGDVYVDEAVIVD